MNIRLLLQDIVDAFRRRLAYLLTPWVLLFLTGAGTAFLLPAEFESAGTIGIRTTVQPDGPDTPFRFSDPAAALREALLDSAVAPGAGAARIEHAGEGVMILTVTDRDPDAAQERARSLTTLAVRLANRADSSRLALTVASYGAAAPPPTPPDPGLPAPAAAPEEDAGYRALRSELARVQSELAAAEGRRAARAAEDSAARGLIAELDDPAVIAALAGGTVPVVFPNRAEIRTAAERTADLMSRYTARHPEVRSARAALRSAVSRGSASLSRAYTQAEEEAADLLRTRDGLRVRIAAWRQELPAHSPDLRREAAPRGPSTPDALQLVRDLYARGGPRFVVLRPPDLPREPVRPLRALIIGGGALAGLLAGILAVALAEAFDPTIRRPGDLAVFGKPVIATIP
jgi:uncharacterized protein involved in exopolysaccharide biosynthesis